MTPETYEHSTLQRRCGQAKYLPFSSAPKWGRPLPGKRFLQVQSGMHARWPLDGGRQGCCRSGQDRMQRWENAIYLAPTRSMD